MIEINGQREREKKISEIRIPIYTGLLSFNTILLIRIATNLLTNILCGI